MNPEDLSGADIIKIAELRGFKVLLNPGPPPMPFLRDPGGHIPPPTDPLIQALKAYREEIIEELVPR